MSCAAYLREKIRTSGPLTVASFMGVALTHPTHGYYTTHNPFGEEGDFITAPHISQMFGEIVGAFLLHAWHNAGRPTPWALVELGPGHGLLMQDILRVVTPHTDVHVHLVEVSPRLRAQQASLLKHPSLTWHTDIHSLPYDQPLFIIANEFFDALPIHQFMAHKGAWYERLITWEETGCAFTLSKEPREPQLKKLPPVEGTCMEESTVALETARLLGERLHTQKGLALIIDYGYAHKEATGDTLQALRNHHPCSVLAHPGTADITAHVDFYALRQVLRHEGCSPWPLSSQGTWLDTHGIGLRAQKLQRHATPPQKRQIRHALERLISPHHMGDLFKVLVVPAF